jgi:penicillin-binding protein-related factor A (putative recombinase)
MSVNCALIYDDNGNPVNFAAPNGKPSELYLDLLRAYDNNAPAAKRDYLKVYTAAANNLTNGWTAVRRVYSTDTKYSNSEFSYFTQAAPETFSEDYESSQFVDTRGKYLLAGSKEYQELAIDFERGTKTKIDLRIPATQRTIPTIFNVTPEEFVRSLESNNGTMVGKIKVYKEGKERTAVQRDIDSYNEYRGGTYITLNKTQGELKDIYRTRILKKVEPLDPRIVKQGNLAAIQNEFFKYVKSKGYLGIYSESPQSDGFVITFDRSQVLNPSQINRALDAHGEPVLIQNNGSLAITKLPSPRETAQSRSANSDALAARLLKLEQEKKAQDTGVQPVVSKTRSQLAVEGLFDKAQTFDETSGTYNGLLLDYFNNLKEYQDNGVTLEFLTNLYERRSTPFDEVIGNENLTEGSYFVSADGVTGMVVKGNRDNFIVITNGGVMSMNREDILTEYFPLRDTAPSFVNVSEEYAEIIAESDSVMDKFFSNPEAVAKAVKDVMEHMDNLRKFGYDFIKTLSC